MREFLLILAVIVLIGLCIDHYFDPR